MTHESRVIGHLPRPLGDMPGVVHGDALLVLGGASGMENRDEILAVSADGTVREVGRLPEPLRGHQAVRIGSAAIVIGGFTGETVATGFRLDLESFASRPIAPMPRGSAWFTAAESGGRIYVVGGFSIPEGYWPDIAVYDPQADRWEVVEDGFRDGPFPKAILGSNTVVAAGERILSFGGADTFDGGTMRANALDAAAAFDPATRSWTALPAGMEPREGLVGVTHGDKAYLVGGMRNAPEHSSPLVEEVDLATGSVTPFATLKEGRTAAACGVLGTTLVVAGGVTEGVANMTGTIEAISL